MIIIDPSEAQFLPSNLLELPHYVLPDFESTTGADIALSTWNAPAANSAMAWKHVRRGCGYQLKRGADMTASVWDGRAMSQLVRMLEFWPTPWCVHVANIDRARIEPVGPGIRMCDLRIDGVDVNFSYSAYLTAIRNWQRAGGLWQTLSPNYAFELWVADELRRMGEDSEERIVRKPQQALIPLTPQEETIASFPGLGQTRAHALWKELKNYGATQTLTQAFVWLSDGTATRTEGIGKGLIEKARNHMGLGDKENLGLYFNGDWPELKGGEKQ